MRYGFTPRVVSGLVVGWALAGCGDDAAGDASDTSQASDTAVAAETSTSSDATVAAETNAPSDTTVASETHADAAPDSDTTPPTVVDLVFAANFAAGGDCRLGIASDACDIYVARMRPDDGSVSGILRVTSAASGESFPAWHPTADLVYFSASVGNATEIDWARPSTLASGTLVANAKQPTLAADGTMVYAELATHTIRLGKVAGDGSSLGATSALTGVTRQFEPSISADGQRIAFYQEFPNNDTERSAQARYYDRGAGKTYDLSEQDGTAHCRMAPDGDLVVCQNTQELGVTGWPIGADGPTGAAYVFVPKTSVATMTAIDTAYASCDAVSLSYFAFCPDTAHVVATAQCDVGAPQPHGANTVFSRLVLVDLSTDPPTYRPLGANLASAFAAKATNLGTDSFTAACRLDQP